MTRKIQVLMLALVALTGSGSRAQPPTGFELALVAVDGTRIVLARLPPPVHAPRISPDGKRVAFETRDLSGADGPRLWIGDVANIGARKVLPLAAGPVNWAPMWTPDGQRLVFIVSGENGDAVYWRQRRG
jgi:Tol biopolymer transport system component